MICIVDYGLGNIQAFANVYKRLNIEVRVARCAADLAGAQRLILPGVGAFDHAMQLLQASGMRATLDELVLQRQVPVLGICVGMQILAAGSDEGSLPGLGWIQGRVRSFAAQPALSKLPLPHMGWNDVEPQPGEPLFAGMETDARYYFLHSYFFDCARPELHTAACARYGVDFACAVRRDHIAGVQFHPEKSHHWGTGLLRNFAQVA
jgi:glutamine amidotransferase